MIKVAVLLSTYNGERYLAEQLKSVLAQQEIDLSVIIRDDGSQDGTIRVIKQFQNKYANIRLIEGYNCGSSKSFMNLIYEVQKKYNEYDFYAFCDQDDVWLPNKLISAIEKLERFDNSCPCLYLGSYQMVDSELTNIPTPQKHPSLNMISAFVSNPATGCTMVFNKSLLEVVASRIPSYIVMHDYWFYLVCLAVGGYVVYDNTPYILYRQHDHNVIGGKKDPFFKKWRMRAIKTFKAGDYYKSRMASQLLECFGDRICKKDKDFLEQVSTCIKFTSRVKLLNNKSFRGKTLDKNLQLLGLIITGKL